MFVLGTMFSYPDKTSFHKPSSCCLLPVETMASWYDLSFSCSPSFGRVSRALLRPAGPVPSWYEPQYTCLICSDCTLPSFSQQNSWKHEEDPTHVRRMKAVATDFQNYIQRSQEVLVIMKSLEAHHTPEELKLLAYNILVESAIKSKHVEITSLRSKADRVIWMTQSVLLELALWKIACILHPPAKVCTSVTALFAWMEKGWKENKETMRHNELIHVVMQNVMPFLEKPPQETE